MVCSVTYEQGGLLVKTPYDPGFVAGIKALPQTARKFDPGNKAWLVDPQYGNLVQRLIQAIFNEQVAIPAGQKVVSSQLQTLEIRYLGSCKDRGDETSAYGFCQGSWSVIFPEITLRAWFEGIQVDQPQPINSTLYAVLGIKQIAGPDEIKSAFRRMALQWHPDHCKEPDAGERFIRIKAAYDLLSDPNKRARYDAGLALEASLGKAQTPTSSFGMYRAPLRCGHVLAEGIYQLGRFRVEKIMAWEDIVNTYGQTLIVSWPAGADRFTEQWV